MSLSIGIERPSLSTTPVGTEGGDQRIWEVEVGIGWKKHPWGQRRSTLGRVEQSHSELSRVLSMDIEPPSLSTAPVGTEVGDQKFRRLRLVPDGRSSLGDNGGVHQAE